jgi:uncharacterized coiled-coil protein SlyX
VPALTFIDVAQLVYEAGFPGGEASAITVAVCACESGRDPGFKKQITGDPATNPAVGSYDRGLCAINSYWHPEVSDACAFDPKCALKEMLRITEGGTDFGSFGCYTTGQYISHMEAARVALDGADRVRKATAQIGALKAKLDAATSLIVTLQAQVASQDAQIDTLAASVAELDQQVLDLQGQVTALQGKIDKAKEALA